MPRKQASDKSRNDASPGQSNRAHEDSRSGHNNSKLKTDLSMLTPQGILYLQRTMGNQAVIRLLGRSEHTIQRAFHPATVDSKTHLRSAALGGGVNTGTKVGRNIPSNAEVIIDPADQQIQNRRVFGNVTWTRAVDKTADQWDPAIDPANTRYIRNSKVTPTAYPRPATLNIGSRGQLSVQQRWHEDVGEYLDIEASIDDPTRQIIQTSNGAFQSMTAAHVLAALTPLEQTQVNNVGRKDSAKDRLRIILTDAANARGLNPALLATQGNIDAIMHEGTIGEQEKSPLRYLEATGSQQEQDRWYEWAHAVFAKIAQGADDLVQSVLHWKDTVYPPDPTQCTVTQIQLEGSDLHDKGLGAAFVTYAKPNDANGMFPNVPSVRVVIKPEDRSIEKSLFGTQVGSLANQVNNIVGLGLNDAITTLKMETHHQHGAIIEFVQGQHARAINDTGVPTQAMSEGIAFAFLAGMSDVHQDNVIWNNGKPYFIDADNSLNASKLQAAESQSGFSKFSSARTTTDVNDINNNPAMAQSAIIQAINAHHTPLITAIQNAFAGKKGRIVPLYTDFWAQRFKGMFSYMIRDVGNPADLPANALTRWSIANHAAGKIEAGAPDAGPGLVGECGTSSAGRFFNQNLEAQLIKADLDQGKIPFYEYDYTTGHILHNGQVIWHGQSLNDALNILIAKFPTP